MNPSLTDLLCVGCGLCCDGSLFADVELAGRAEVTRLEVLGLEVEDDGASRGLLSLPCAALRGRRCSIYPHRPKCCRTFECRLLQDVRRGAVGLERAKEQVTVTLERIEQVRSLMRQLGRHDTSLPLAESCAEALTSDGNPGAMRARAELEAAMSDVAESMRRTFLDAQESRPDHIGRSE